MKRKLKTLFVALALSAGVNAQNPISPYGVYIPDPAARVFNGKMYVYGSLDESLTNYCSKHYHVLESSNLKDWTLYMDCFTNPETLYAPDAIYKNGTYYLYYDCPDGSEWVATSQSPTGPFADGVQIKGIRGIDPNVFVDDDGQAYYFWGQFSAKGAKMNPDMKTLDMSSIKDGIVTEKDHYFHEGSYVFKRGKYYYFTYASVARKNQATGLAYAMSTNPLGPYEYKGIIIDNSGCDPEVWNDHGSIVEFQGKWYVLYHRSTHGTRFMRKACIEPLRFAKDGSIIEAEMTSQGAAGPLKASEQTDGARACLMNGHARITLMEGCANREVLSGIRGGDWAAFKYLDFGKKPTKATFRVRTQAPCGLSVGYDQLYRGQRFSLNFPDTGNEWKEFTTELPEKASVTGVHAVFLWFSGDANKDLMELDWMKFE
ncbi:MAG: family 43 glycosylhydrolase [Prevotellaceae bacterium]|nr:family 43 glycosylhydrolase [Prevotellaceae bacterium]